MFGLLDVRDLLQTTEPFRHYLLHHWISESLDPHRFRLLPKEERPLAGLVHQFDHKSVAVVDLHLDSVEVVAVEELSRISILKRYTDEACPVLLLLGFIHRLPKWSFPQIQ